MNTLVALMIVTATGVVEAPNNFNSMQECQAVVLKLKAEAIEKGYTSAFVVAYENGLKIPVDKALKTKTN